MTVVKDKRKTRFSNSLFGHFASQYERYAEGDGEFDGQPETTLYRVHLSLPRWLLSRAWDFQVKLACSGWTTHFRQYAVLPTNSELFRTVKYGTVPSKNCSTCSAKAHRRFLWMRWV
ncbi:hypothetical protein VTK26DRAFT_804 [Humicola hyalothermophila]